jgi:hypothetical protein
MIAALAKKLAAMLFQMTNQVNALHGSNIASPPMTFNHELGRIRD